MATRTTGEGRFIGIQVMRLLLERGEKREVIFSRNPLRSVVGAQTRTMGRILLAAFLTVMATSQTSWADGWILWHKFLFIDKTKSVDQQTQKQTWQQLDTFESQQACENELEAALQSMTREASKDAWHIDVTRESMSIASIHGRNHEDLGQATKLMHGGITCRPTNDPPLER
jgi:hypothetical protein